MISFLLKSPQANESLNKDGFAVIPFLNELELEQLRNFYIQKHTTLMPKEHVGGIHMTTWCQDLNYKLEIKNNISHIVEAAITRAFMEYRVLNHVFIVKDTGVKTDFKVHQDWSVVDETKHAAINVWFPLYDVDNTSGALWVLKGSHHINRPIRGSSYLFPDYSAFFNQIEQSAQSIPLKAGQAVVFFTNTIHGSPDNLGSQPRVASCFTLVPEKAPIHIYFQNEKDKPLQLHEPSDDFMYYYNNLRVDSLHNPPNHEIKEAFPSYVNLPVSLKELKPYLKKRNFLSFLMPKSKVL